MTRHLLIVGLAIVLGTARVGAAATAGTATGSNGVLKAAPSFPGQFRPFTLKGEGQLDLANESVAFEGEASHVGRFAAAGVKSGEPRVLRGRITTSPGD